MTRWTDYFTSSGAAAERLVPALAARLMGRDGGASESGGEVTSPLHLDPQTGLPAQGGFLDPAIFGPDGARPGHITLPEALLHPALRPCVSRLTGLTEDEVRAVARFDTCLEGDKVVARERLERSEIDYDVIRAAGGAQALRRLLKSRGQTEAPFLDAVPVLPPVVRALERTDAGVLLPGQIGWAYKELLELVAWYRRRSAWSTSASLLMSTWEQVQDAFDGLCATVAGRAAQPEVALDEAWLSSHARAWSQATAGVVGTPEKVLERTRTCLVPTVPDPPFANPTYFLDPLTPVECRFVDADFSSLVLQLPYAMVRVDLKRRELRWAVRAPHAAILQVLAGSTHAFCAARGDVLPWAHLLDLRTGTWLTQWDAVQPPAFPMGCYKDERWFVYDYGRRSARPLHRAGNGKEGALLSPCLRYAWIHQDDAIVRLDDEAPQLELASLPRVEAPPAWSLWRPGEQPLDVPLTDPGVWPCAPSAQADLDDDDELEELEDEPEQDEGEDDTRLTFVATATGFRVFHLGVLSQCARETWRHPGAYSSAAFDAAGVRLAIARPGEVVVHQLDADGRPIAEDRISLLPFEDRLSLRRARMGVPAMTRAVEMSLLTQTGTVEALLKAPMESLAPSFGPFQEETPDEIAPELVEEIRAVLRAR